MMMAKHINYINQRKTVHYTYHNFRIIISLTQVITNTSSNTDTRRRQRQLEKMESILLSPPVVRDLIPMQQNQHLQKIFLAPGRE